MPALVLDRAGLMLGYNREILPDAEFLATYGESKESVDRLVQRLEVLVKVARADGEMVVELLNLPDCRFTAEAEAQAAVLQEIERLFGALGEIAHRLPMGVG